MDAPVAVVGIANPVEPLAARLGQCATVLDQCDCLGRFRAAISNAEVEVCDTAPYILSLLMRGIDRPLKRAALACLTALRSAGPASVFDTAVAEWVCRQYRESTEIPLLPEAIALFSVLLEEQTLRSGLGAAGPVMSILLVNWCERGARGGPDELRATSRLLPLVLQPADFPSMCQANVALRAALARLVRAYLDVLPQRCVSRDTVTLACMALAAATRTLLLAASDTTDGQTGAVEVQQAFILRLMGCGASLSSGAAISVTADVAPLSAEWASSLGFTAYLALIRALCVAFSPAVLGLPLARTGAAAPAAMAPCALTACLGPTILRCCQHPDPELRLHAIQSLESWLVVLRKTQAWLRSQVLSIAAESSIIDDSLVAEILRLVLANWEHSNRRITGGS